MTVEAMGVVLNYSRATGTTKLVLVGIANHDGDGGAWPSIATLARYANTSERSVQRAIQRLVDMGEVEVHANGGGTLTTPNDRRPNRYTILVRRPVDNRDNGVTPVSPRAVNGVTPVTQRGDASVAHGVTPVSPEPPLNHPELARDASGRAGGPVDVDGQGNVAALRAAFAAHPTLDSVGGWTSPGVPELLHDLIELHGVDRLVRAVVDTRQPPRVVRAFLRRWDDLPPPPPSRAAHGVVIHCALCGLPETACRNRSPRQRETDPHEFIHPHEGSPT